jgi:hypothetical protein
MKVIELLCLLYEDDDDDSAAVKLHLIFLN